MQRVYDLEKDGQNREELVSGGDKKAKKGTLVLLASFKHRQRERPPIKSSMAHKAT